MLMDVDYEENMAMDVDYENMEMDIDYENLQMDVDYIMKGVCKWTQNKNNKKNNKIYLIININIK